MRAPLAVTIAAFLALSACSGAERPSADRPRAAPPEAHVASTAEPVEDHSLVVPEDDHAPDGPACMHASDCEGALQCRGAPGCGSDWACGEPRECLAESVSYCDCDGSTFYAPGGCPGRPYAHLGPCESIGELVAAGTELGVPDWDEQPTTEDRTCGSSAECGRGQTCFGIAGCANEWRCVRARGCSRERISFCGCDGESFVSSATCPGRPFVHRGECRGEALASVEPERAASPEPTAERATASAERPTAVPDRATVGATTAPRTAPDAAVSTATARGGAAVCRTSRDCSRGQVCQGAPGCGMEWTCGRPERTCIQDTQVFCDCEGRDFRASMFCPGRPFAHRGSCEIDRMLDLSGAAVR